MSIAEQVTPDFANSIRLAGTASQRTVELRQGHWYTLHVGAVPVCVIDGADDVAAVIGRPILGAYTTLSFILDRGNGYIAAIAADGSTAFTLDVVPSSPGAGAA